MQYLELLWPSDILSNNYICLDLETTVLPDIDGLPDIVTAGITIVEERRIAHAEEFRVKPSRMISRRAEEIHGISNSAASGFPPFAHQWNNISELISDQLVVIHNASFDWPILVEHVTRFSLQAPKVARYSARKSRPFLGR